MGMMFRGFGGGPQQWPAAPIDGNMSAPQAGPVQSMGDFASMPALPAPKPSFFGEGGVGLGIAGTIGDALLNMSGGQAVYAPAMRQQQQQQFAIQQHAADQQSELQRQLAVKAYELAHPAPTAPHFFEANNGDQFQVDPSTGQPKLVYHDPTPKTTYTPVKNADGTTTIYPTVNGQIVGAQSPAAGTPDLPSGFTVRGKGGAASQPGSFQPARPKTVFDALISQESGGRAGAIGPQTPYGHAIGMTQMLPATAAAQAKRLGVPWRPDLLAANSPEGAEYQRALGESYFQEGYDKTGNVIDALHYYHGGPDRRLWGPKTKAYARDVLARMKG